MSAVCDCLLNIFSATLHVLGRSSICSLRTLRALLTVAHLTFVSLRLPLLTAHLRILFVNNYLQTMCKEELVVLFKVLFWELPVGLRKAMRTFSHDHRSSGRDLNTGPSRYEAEAVLCFSQGCPLLYFGGCSPCFVTAYRSRLQGSTSPIEWERYAAPKRL